MIVVFLDFLIFFILLISCVCGCVGQALNGDVQSASIQLPNIKHVWDPRVQGFVPDPEQVARLSNYHFDPSERRTEKGKKRITRNFFRL